MKDCRGGISMPILTDKRLLCRKISARRSSKLAGFVIADWRLKIEDLRFWILNGDTDGQFA